MDGLIAQPVVQRGGPVKTQPDDADKRAEGKSSAFGIGTVIRGLRRYPLLALSFFLVAAAAGAGIWFFLPLPKMTAYVVFQISARPDAVISPDPNFYYRRQLQLVKSRSVLTAAVREGGIADSALLSREPSTSAKVALLDSKLGVDARLQPDFMRLTLEGDNETEIAAIIKAVADSYMKESAKRDRSVLKDRLDSLNKNQETYARALLSTQNRLKNIAESTHTIEPSNAILREKFIQEQLGMAQRELLQIESEMRHAQVEAITLDPNATGLDKIAVPEEVFLGAVKTDSGYQELIARQAYLKESIEKTKATLNPGERPPDLVDYEKQLAGLKKGIEDYVERIRPKVTARIQEASLEEHIRLAASKIDVPEEVFLAAVKTDPGYQKLIDRQAYLKQSIEETKESLNPGAHPPVLVEKEEQLAGVNKEIVVYLKKIRPEVTARIKEASVAERKRQAANLSEKSIGLNNLRAAVIQDIERLDRLINKLPVGQVELESLRQAMAKIERTSEHNQDQIELLQPEMEAQARVGIFDEPVVVQGIEGNRRLKYSLLAFGGFFLFGVGLIAYLEARNRRIIKTQDAADDLGLNLIGTVPAIPRISKTATAREGGQAEVWHAMLTESVDVARTVLVHSLGPKKSGHSILIASAMPGEGKTLLACHLASSFARAGFRTLLVDGDMRRPTVHRVLGTPQTPGLCELLRGEIAPQDAIRPGPVPGLSFLPAGLWDLRVAPTLSTDRWETLRGQLEGSFDYVLIDSSPLLLVTDTLLLGRNSEGVVLSVLRDVSHVNDLELARDRLKFLGIKVLGVVVNGFNGPGYSHAYPYYRPEMHANVEAATVPQSTTAG
jgi:capsular exopolysaccharide synthesis family protein